MNDYCTRLSLNVNPLKNNVHFKDIARNPKGSEFEFNKHVEVPSSMLSDELVSLLSALGARVGHAELFYTNPYQITSIHTDIHPGDLVKLNFVFGGRGSKMCWYKVANTTLKSTNFTELVDSPYIFYKPNEVLFLYKEEIESPSIIQAGIPHNIQNSDEERFCLSITLLKKETNQSAYDVKDPDVRARFVKECCITMESAKLLFSEYISK